jgi:hypothetical protein
VIKSQTSFLLFRLAIGHVAALIGIIGIWIAVPELLRPSLSYFPSNNSEAETWSAARMSSAAAARIGAIRGDLWTMAAISSAAMFLFETAPKNAQEARAASIEEVQRAIKLAPHDARSWLVLANLLGRDEKAGSKAAEALMLSYYTGSSERALTPLRLSVALQSDAILDPDLQTLVQLEIQRVVIRNRELKPAVAAAYKSANAKGREIVEAALVQVDPTFLDEIMGSPQPK